MAKKKPGDAHGGGHGWFVTFAGLMGLMMSFFVMLVAFSTMDNNKLKIVAGSMRDAFGVQTDKRYSGIIESDGLPTRPKLKYSAHINPQDSSNTPTPDQSDNAKTTGGKLKVDREFMLASASLRQALQDMPELTEISKHIMFEDTKEGLNLEIVDQDGRSMFADGSKVPYDRTRRQPRDRRPGWPLDVCRRLQGALRPRPPATSRSSTRMAARCLPTAPRCLTTAPAGNLEIVDQDGRSMFADGSKVPYHR